MHIEQDASSNVVKVNKSDPDEIICDPALRRQISSYALEVQDQMRRAYIN
jgi:hypothetical protein